MRLVNTLAHGILDYVFAVVFAAFPWLFDFPAGGTAHMVAVCCGIALLALAALTGYELGMIKVIGLRVHLALEVVAGIFLASSPWILDFDGVAYKPHLVFGITWTIISILTDRIPHRQETHS